LSAISAANLSIESRHLDLSVKEKRLMSFAVGCLQ
jgi:hypothetical protein